MRRPVRAAMSLTATTTAVAAAGVVLSPTAGHAASAAQIQAQIAALDVQAENATNVYDQTEEQFAALRKQVDAIQSQAAAVQQSVNALTSALGPQAAAQYRSGSVDPSLQLLLSGSPDHYLQQAAMASQVAQNEAVALRSLKAEQAQLAALKKQATDRFAQLQAAEQQAVADKAQVLGAVRQKQALLAQLTYAQQLAVQPPVSYYGVTPAQIAALPQVSGRAGVAVAFAKSKIGMWYQWGGTGDPSYDCSGLTQAAWMAAGVQLGRTTYDQVTDGYAVPAILANLQPGDLIFYNGNEHMAIYVGNGVVVHAPTTGQQIQYAPWNLLPIDAVRRVI